MEEELRDSLKKEYYKEFSIVDKFIDSISIHYYYNSVNKENGNDHSHLVFIIKTDLFYINYDHLYYIKGDICHNELMINNDSNKINLDFNNKNKYYKQVEHIMDLIENEQYKAKHCCTIFNIVLSILEFFGVDEFLDNSNLVEPIEEHDLTILNKIDELQSIQKKILH
jgi:hypothetical protein